MPVFLRYLLRLGPTNPIAVRLVQNGSRRTRHLYIRAAYLAALIIVLLWSLLLNTEAGAISYNQLAKAGALSFTYIAYLQIGLICILAPVFMGGAISQEADPRTWEVLLTTPMGAAEIVLGNLFGRLFFILALLIASLPLFALTQFFGGVPPQAIFASYLVAACAALLVGAIAIALSVSRLAGKRAFFVFYVAVVSYLAVTLAVDRYLVGTGRGSVDGSGVTVMTALNPFLTLHALLNPTTYPRAVATPDASLLSWVLQRPVTAFCLLSTSLSLLFMIISVITARVGGIPALASGGSGIPLHRRIFGLGAKGAEHRPPRQVWTNPIAWREAAARNATLGKILLRYAFLTLGGLFGLFLIYLFHTGELTLTQFRFALGATVWAELAVVALVAVNTSATAISREREDGTLDLLLTTPLSASSYLAGKLRGLVTYLIPLLLVPLGTLTLAGLYSLFTTQTSTMVSNQNTITLPPILPEAGLLATAVVIPFMAFVVMVGLQWSLKSRGTLSSVVGTVGVVGVAAGIVGLCAWNASGQIPVLGPVLAALSPASLVNAMVYPEDALRDSISQTSLLGARLSTLVGSVVAAVVYAGICYGIHSAMVRSFDMTVRRLAGTR